MEEKKNRQEWPRECDQGGRRGTKGILGARREGAKVWNGAGTRVHGQFSCAAGSDPNQSRREGQKGATGKTGKEN